MKLRGSMFRFLVLSVFAAGAFSFLSVQNAKADGWFCWIDWDYRNAVCNTQYDTCVAACTVDYCTPCQQSEINVCLQARERCYRGNDAKQQSCYSADAWQSWLYQVDLNIGDNFRILDEPNPACANYPGALDNCAGLPTAEEIDACVMMIQQEQARDHCP